MATVARSTIVVNGRAADDPAATVSAGIGHVEPKGQGKGGKERGDENGGRRGMDRPKRHREGVRERD